MSFELPKLKYDYAALEPVIDAKTMEIHHTKHHATYVTKLNSALENYPNLQNKTIEDLLKKINDIPEEIRTTVINNGGGHHNHSLYWEIMTPGGSKAPKADLAAMINNTFGDLKTLKDLLVKEALSRFGSGWAWLASDLNKDLEIFSTPNQDSPLLSGLTPILGVDVWEHAYYLNYQNRRQEYVEKWLEIVNWDIVGKFYDQI